MNDTTSAPTEQPCVPEQRLERLRALATTLTSLGLVGRWGWFGQDATPYLSTRGGGRQIVLTLTGQARVRTPASDGGPCIMRTPREIPVYEVAPDATSARDTRVYRRDVIGMRTPVAEWLAECDPDTVLALLVEVTRLRAALAADPAAVTIAVPSVPHPGSRTDAHFLRTVAWNLRHGYEVGGSNVTSTVSVLLDRVATALDGAPPREDDEAARCRPDVNDAAERFDASDLLEALVEEAEGDCLVLDGAEWWLSDTETEPGSFTITDDETGQSFRVELDAVIRKVERTPAAGRAVDDVVSSL